MDKNFIVYLLPAIIAAMVSLMISLLTMRANSIISKKQLSVQYKTDRRLDWIQEVREELSIFVSRTVEFERLIKVKNEKNFEKIREFNKSYLKLQILFNPLGDLERMILTNAIRIKNIVNFFEANVGNTDLKIGDLKVDELDMIGCVEIITLVSQIELKYEWWRVSQEVSKGKGISRIDEYKKQIELCGSYLDLIKDKDDIRHIALQVIIESLEIKKNKIKRERHLLR